MVNPVSSAHSRPEPQAASRAAKQPPPQTSSQPQDKVTVKSAGDKDRDGDNQ